MASTSLAFHSMMTSSGLALSLMPGSIVVGGGRSSGSPVVLVAGGFCRWRWGLWGLAGGGGENGEPFPYCRRSQAAAEVMEVTIAQVSLRTGHRHQCPQPLIAL